MTLIINNCSVNSINKRNNGIFYHVEIVILLQIFFLFCPYQDVATFLFIIACLHHILQHIYLVFLVQISTVTLIIFTTYI